MSLLFPERVTVWVTQDSVSFLRRPRQGKGLARTCVLSAPYLDSDPLAAFGQALQQYRAQYPEAARFEVVVSNAHAQYLLLPCQSEIRTQQEQALYVAHSFHEMYDRQADAWSFSWDTGLSQRPVLACALPAPMVQGLERAFDLPGCDLVSVQPYLMFFFNHVLAPREEKSWRCMLIEGQQLVSWDIRDGQWHGLHQVRLEPDWQERLEWLLHRQMLLADWDDAEMPWLFAAEGRLEPGGQAVRLVRSVPQEVLCRDGQPLPMTGVQA